MLFFIFGLLIFTSNVHAGTGAYEYDVKCLRDLKDYLPANRSLELKNRNTFLFMAKETELPQMPPGMKPSLLRIDENGVLISKADWTKKDPTYFKVPTSSGFQNVDVSETLGMSEKENSAMNWLYYTKYQFDKSVTLSGDEALRNILILGIKKKMENDIKNNQPPTQPGNCEFAKTLSQSAIDIENLRRSLFAPSNNTKSERTDPAQTGNAEGQETP